MRVIVIGLGSMGKRRIRLIQQIDKDIEIIGIDERIDRREETARLYEIDIKGSIGEAFQVGADCAFIATSPLSHSSIIRESLLAELNVFTEINLIADGYDENIKLAKEKGVTLFLSSTPMYRKEINYIKESVASDKKDKALAYQYHIGQYLPDWHPWESFQDFFISDKRTSGCREILAIELPWIQDTFGEIEGWKIQRGKLTKLPIDYQDTYQILIKHKGGNMGMLQIDVHSRLATRNFICTGENLYIKWHGTVDTLYSYNIQTGEDEHILLYDKADQLNGYSRNIIEDAYKDEILEFFDCVSKGKLHGRYSFEKDRGLLGIIDLMEGA